MILMNRQILLCLTLSALLACNIAHAEKADQDKPIILEAEKVSVNDVQQT
jgi:lipopolysaccharide export system protein LptA